MPFEPTIRTATVFFAALIGFGLKHLLDQPATTLDQYKWAYFLIAFALFLRFLLGSANHLWKEYGKEKYTPERRDAILFDIACLAVFGVLATLTCYAESVSAFLLMIAALSSCALLYNVIGLVRERRQGPIVWSQKWLVLNLIQSCATLWVYHQMPSKDQSPSLFWIVILSVVSIGLMLLDVRHQLSSVNTNS